MQASTARRREGWEGRSRALEGGRVGLVVGQQLIGPVHGRPSIVAGPVERRILRDGRRVRGGRVQGAAPVGQHRAGSGCPRRRSSPAGPRRATRGQQGRRQQGVGLKVAEHRRRQFEAGGQVSGSLGGRPAAGSQRPGPGRPPGERPQPAGQRRRGPRAGPGTGPSPATSSGSARSRLAGRNHDAVAQLGQPGEGQRPASAGRAPRPSCPRWSPPPGASRRPTARSPARLARWRRWRSTSCPASR